MTVIRVMFTLHTKKAIVKIGCIRMYIKRVGKLVIQLPWDIAFVRYGRLGSGTSQNVLRRHVKDVFAHLSAHTQGIILDNWNDTWNKKASFEAFFVIVAQVDILFFQLYSFLDRNSHLGY